MPNDSIAQLRQILGQDKLKRRLNNLRDTALKWLQAQGGPDAKRIGSNTLHPQECQLLRGMFRTLLREPQGVLQGEIIAQLERPSIITDEDLADIALEHLLVPADEFDQALIRFGRSVISRVSFRVGHPQPLAVSDAQIESSKQHMVLWKTELASISLCGSGPVGAEPELRALSEPDRAMVLYARVNLCGSDRAVGNLQGEAMPLLRSLLLTFTQLHDGPPEAEASPLPRIEEPAIWGDLDRVGACVDLCFAKPAKGDTMQSRLRNAMLLLTEADRQKHFAIAVSLCFSAMEALLGRGTSDIISTLSRNIATLLEPPNANRTAAIKLVKDLYNVRSKVLHGASLDHDPATRQQCRFLAAAVFAAVLERTAAAKSADGRLESPDAFFAVLEDAQMNGQSVEGVSPSAARNLWSMGGKP